MPISKYYDGHGTEVMREMQQKHGKEEGERIFYATANKRGQKPAQDAAAYDAECARLHRALDHVLDCMEARSRR